MSIKDTVRDSLIAPEDYDEPDLPGDGSRVWLGRLIVGGWVLCVCVLIAWAFAGR
jgi:hypothetical protein